MSTEELIKSVDRKLELLLLDKDELKEIILGKGANPGIVDDIKEIRKVLEGDSKLQIEGLIAKVNRLDDLHKKFRTTGAVIGGMIALGGSVGAFITWAIHKADKIKEFFS